MIKKLSWEHLAGFMDGEVYVGIIEIKRKFSIQYRLVVSLVNTYLPVLKMAQAKAGGRLTPRRVKARHCQSWTLNWTGIRAKKMLIKIYPYSRIKRKQIELAIKFPFGMLGGGILEGRKLLRERIYNEMKLLNGTGENRRWTLEIK